MAIPLRVYFVAWGIAKTTLTVVLCLIGFALHLLQFVLSLPEIVLGRITVSFDRFLGAAVEKSNPSLKLPERMRVLLDFNAESLEFAYLQYVNDVNRVRILGKLEPESPDRGYATGVPVDITEFVDRYFDHVATELEQTETILCKADRFSVCTCDEWDTLDRCPKRGR